MEPGINKISQKFSKGNFEYTYNYMVVDIEWNVIKSYSIEIKND